ncbi:CHAT domain-containing protein [Streptomyces sp. NPDC086182]|jgi:hypothetical protein|uniref:CHAT domain-containing protein n=1 Tax=Streptomyces sp. NPDC086182 TaxID=3155058 RepID=UPI0034155632
MSESLYRRLIDSTVLDLFGRLFPDGISASALLVPLGVDPARLPAFGSQAPSHWWFGAFTEMYRGAFEPHSLQETVAAAAARFPGEPTLAHLAGEVAATAPGSGPGSVETPGPLRVLVFLADPTDHARLRLQAEERILREIREPARLDVTVCPAARATDVLPALLDARPDVVHFSGHGSVDGMLIFEDALGGSAPVSARALGRAFEAADSDTALKCVVLNSCYTGAYGEALSESSWAVIGSTQALGDECALAFTRGFYQALAKGRELSSAYALALAEVALSGFPEDEFRFLPRKG